jgi:hypothetical protein
VRRDKFGCEAVNIGTRHHVTPSHYTCAHRDGRVTHLNANDASPLECATARHVNRVKLCELNVPTSVLARSWTLSRGGVETPINRIGDTLTHP